MPKRHPKLVTSIPSNSSSLHLEAICPSISSQISSSFNTKRTLALEAASPLPPPFSFQIVQKDSLIEKEFEKEWETVWEVFPGLSDNPSELAAIPLTNPSTTNTSTSSSTHCTTSLITLTTISQTHLSTISCTNITISNRTPKLAQTTHKTIATTTTSIFEPATFHKQPPSKNKISIKNLPASPYQREVHQH